MVKKEDEKNADINLTFTSKLQECNKTSIISGYALKAEN